MYMAIIISPAPSLAGGGDWPLQLKEFYIMLIVTNTF